jgi:hypothetical protein
MKESGKRQGVIREVNGKYQLRDGTPFDMNDIKQLLEVIRKNPEVKYIDPKTGFEDKPLTVLIDGLQNLSEERATSVRKSVLSFAHQRQWRIDESQIQAKSVGATEPIQVVPIRPDDPKKNMRVEFRIVRISQADRIASESDIDF